MERGQAEGQLELFDVAHGATLRAQRVSIGRLSVSLRYDQIVIAMIVSLIGTAVVFGLGVERGKQLVRGERATLLTQPPPATSVGGQPVEAKDVKERKRVGEVRSAGPSAPINAPRLKPFKKATPSKTRYAVQVVTYSRLQLARREMERLESKGERVFLVMGEGQTRVYVGPFPSKANASEKLDILRPLYRDCFVKLL